MAYEREALAQPSTSSVPSVSSTPIMREERTVDPYRARAMQPLPSAPQPGTPPQKEAAPAEEAAVQLSPQVAALARREQKFRQQQKQFEQEKARVHLDQKELADLKSAKEKLGQKDYSAFDSLVDYNEYSQYQIDKANARNPLQEEVNKLNGKLSELEKMTQDNITKQFEAAVNERRTAAQELVAKSAEFPRIRKAKAHEAVVQHIMDTWEHDSKELSIEQAAKEVEEVLVEKARQWKALLEDEEPNQVNAPDAKRPLPPLRQQGLKTLTNQVTSGDLKGSQKSLYLMNEAERYAEARRRAEEKLRQRG